jgi:hypothetical protein
MARVISNTLNEMNTIIDSSDSPNSSSSNESDDEVLDNFILYGLLQSQ